MRTAVYIMPIVSGVLLDMLIGDPHGMPHPVRAIGALISGLEKCCRNHLAAHLKAAGVFLALMVILLSAAVPCLLLQICYRVHIAAGVIAESVMCFTLLAGKSLTDETMAVYRPLREGNTEAARQAVSMVVGRDTSVLDADGITRAAVETVAENTSDGVTAPLLYMTLFGAVGGFFYKSVNTMDSMIGYRNEKYREIGCFAAHLDDILNYIPSRLTALFMIAAAYLLRMDGKGAWRIWRRDRRKHESPNSAQTESVCAGALGIRLAGDAVYFGEVHHKPYIGDDTRPAEAEDIVRANRLMHATALLFWTACILMRIVLAVVIW